MCWSVVLDHAASSRKLQNHRPACKQLTSREFACVGHRLASVVLGDFTVRSVQWNESETATCCVHVFHVGCLPCSPKYTLAASLVLLCKRSGTRKAASVCSQKLFMKFVSDVLHMKCTLFGCCVCVNVVNVFCLLLPPYMLPVK